jgi:hypothetical protein
MFESYATIGGISVEAAGYATDEDGAVRRGFVFHAFVTREVCETEVGIFEFDER